MNIRRMLIGPVLIVLLGIFWHFMTHAALYDPFALLDLKEKESGDRQELVNEFTTAWGAEIIERNLFSPERRRPKARRAVTVDEKPPEIALKGVMLTRDGQYEAYIQIEKQQPVLVRKGEILKDVQIVDIKENTMTLKWKNKLIELAL